MAGVVIRAMVALAFKTDIQVSRGKEPRPHEE
jgi:hypothetical protein